MHFVILSEMQIGVQKRCLIKLYSTEDFIMEPKGLEMRFKSKSTDTSTKTNCFTSKTPGNGLTWLPFNLASSQFKNYLLRVFINQTTFHFFPYIRSSQGLKGEIMQNIL